MMCKYKSHFNKKAFTLIELLIVIAIIGILFIVLVSKVDFATDKAKASGVQTDFRSFQVAFETVSKENAGFNTFGWDTGDNAGAAPAGYTYTNADKDAGDRIRNSYDEGDTNLNGQYDDGEVWTGRKIYTETWTGCYTLINPGNASDMSAIFDLEIAINKNLDPKLHINIADDGTISMANGYKDPWSTQYHGQYITNASADSAAKWNTDASMAGSIGDNMDRGAILMYSNGANQKFGTKVKIEKGVVTATVSQIDADHPDNNKMGADDYVLAVVYSYTNGYGETSAITEGFSNNQVFLTGNGGNVSNAVTPGGNGGVLQLPDENPTGDLDDYTWSEIQTLAQANLSKDDYKNKYGIEPGDTIVSNGTTYVLVDLDGNNYDGFIFMYNSDTTKAMNSSSTNAGGYASTDVMKPYVDDGNDTNNVDLYDKLDADLKSVIKKVNIVCSEGSEAYASGTYTHTLNNVGLFLASAKEVGFTVSEWTNPNSYINEGDCFDFFTGNTSARISFMNTIGIASNWWLRSANSSYPSSFKDVTASGGNGSVVANETCLVIPCFVIG